MGELRYPSKDELATITGMIKENDGDCLEVVDQNWIDRVHQEMAALSHNEYFEDGSAEYKIAYLAVNLTLLHIFADGNKRTGLLTLACMLTYNNMEGALAVSSETYFSTFKKIADDGTAGREENIQLLKKIILDA